ncbi:MAG: DUF120 domain-containing protein [Thermoplasmata archaeon]
MKPELFFALKKIAELGGMNDWVEITTQELGKLLEKSQQSGALYLKQLAEMELIAKMSGRGSKVRITEKGKMEILKMYKELESILQGKSRLEFVGYVSRGMGEGKFYLGKEQYVEQIFEILGFTPYPGTLNIKLEKESTPALYALKERPGILIKGFQEKDRTYGNVKCFRATILELPCAVVIPERSAYTDILEVISKHNLRKVLNLKDGDRVIVRVDIDER